MNKIGNFKDTDGNNLLGFNFASNIITKDGQSVDDVLDKNNIALNNLNNIIGDINSILDKINGEVI